MALSEVEEPVALEAVRLAPPRIGAPARWRTSAPTTPHARASHALGKSYSDVVRGFRGRFEHPPDFVVHPRDEADVERVLEWCARERVAVIPFGGGTSVVGGVTPDVGPAYNGVVSLDLRALDRVLEVDEVSAPRASRPAPSARSWRRQLGEHGLTLRHFPQSFEFSTLGGWIATRAAGHFATVWTHIEDFVESVRAITPGGRLGVAAAARVGRRGEPRPDARRLRGHAGRDHAGMGARPAAPSHRSSAGVRFASFLDGRGVRARDLAVGAASIQLPPARCGRGRSDDGRRRLARAARARLRVDRPSGGRGDGARPGALRRARRRGVGEPRRRAAADAVELLAGRVPRRALLRDVLVAMGVLGETFETAITWERFPAFHERVSAAAEEAVRERAAARAGSSAASPTSTPMGPRPTSRSSRPRGAGKRSSSGLRSSGRPPTRYRRGRHDHPPPRRRARSPALV